MMVTSAADVPGSPHAALALAGVAGFVDAAGYLLLDKLFVAHMSGNSARLGVALGGAQVSEAAVVAFAILLFVAGIGCGTAVAEWAYRRGRQAIAPLLLGLETALLATPVVVATVVGTPSVVRGCGVFYGLAAPAVLAMGVQTAALRRVGGRSVHTTYVSGVLTGMITQLVLYGFRRADRGDAAPTDDDRATLKDVRVLASVWLLYASGGVLGSITERGLGVHSLLVPIAVLLGVAVMQLHAGSPR